MTLRHSTGTQRYNFYKIQSKDGRVINACTSQNCDKWMGFDASDGSRWFVYPIKENEEIEKVLEQVNEDNKLYFMDMNEHFSDLELLAKCVAAHEFLRIHNI